MSNVRIDGHLDLAYNGVTVGRDLGLELEALRAVERRDRETAMVTWGELRRADVAVVFGTLFARPARPPAPGDGNHRLPGYVDEEGAHRQALDQLAWYEAAERAGHARLLRSVAELDAHLGARAALAPRDRRTGVVILIEGADPVRTPDELDGWYRRGVRLLGPAWRGTRYAGGTGEPGGLTPLGAELIDAMGALGLPLDVSHLAEEAFWQALERHRGPVLASHANARALTPTDRHLSDAMLDALAARDAVVGLVLGDRFLDPAADGPDGGLRRAGRRRPRRAPRRLPRRELAGVPAAGPTAIVNATVAVAADPRAKERGVFARWLAGGGAVLAPMAGYTDAPFRRLAHAFGAAWAVTEMVSARALALGDRTGLDISAPYQGEERVVVQLFAADPEEAAAAAVALVAAYAPAAIDLNMGCPVRKVRHRGCGVELLRDPARAAAIVAAIDAAVDVPVTVKTRLGIDGVGARAVLEAVVAAGAAAIAVHGRTAAQKYDGAADWRAIAEVTSGLGVPVLGSGDVRDAAGFERGRAAGLGVMVARGALGRPWLFRELLGGPAPGFEEITAIAWRHARDHVAWYGGEGALRRLRGQLVAYAAHAAAARDPQRSDPDPGTGDPRRTRDPLGLHAALVRADTLDDIAEAWRRGTGLDPRDPRLAHLGPTAGPLRPPGRRVRRAWTVAAGAPTRGRTG